MIAVYKTWHEYRDHFPKKSRYTLGDRIDFLFLQILELLFTATYQEKDRKILSLERALQQIDVLKFFMRLSWEMAVLDSKKFAHLSEQLQEIGRMLGGWKRGLESKTPTK